MNINDISPDEWSGLLERLVDKTGSQSENPNSQSHIWINKKTKTVFLGGKEEAKESGCTKRLKFDEITELTVNILANCNDDAVRYRAAKAIKYLGRFECNESISSEKGRRLTRIFSTAKDPSAVDKKGLDIATGIDPRAKRDISPQERSEYTRILQTSTSVRRSKAGAQGVLFVKPEKGRVKVIKPTNDSSTVVSADRFYQKLDFKTSKAQSISASSEEYESTQKKLEDDLECSSGERKEQIIKQVRECGSFLVMDCLNATSFNDLTSDQLVEAIQDERVLDQLGQMIFFDIVINNYDRVSRSTANTGNFMLMNPSSLVSSSLSINSAGQESLDSSLGASVVAAKGEDVSDKSPSRDAPRIALIDHELFVTAESLQDIKNNIAYIMDLANHPKFAGMLLGKFLAKHPDRFVDIDQGHFVEGISKGIMHGPEKFLSTFRSPQAFLNAVSTPGLRASEKIDPRALVSIHKFISNNFGVSKRGSRSGG